MRLGTVLDCSFANVASTLPGPIMGRGARRKLFRQSNISFTVIVGVSPLVRQSTNSKRVLNKDRGEGGSTKKMNVWKLKFLQLGYVNPNSNEYIWRIDLLIH